MREPLLTNEPGGLSVPATLRRGLAMSVFAFFGDAHFQRAVAWRNEIYQVEMARNVLATYVSIKSLTFLRDERGRHAIREVSELRRWLAREVASRGAKGVIKIASNE